MPKTKNLRDEAKYRILPPLDAETYAGLKANIAVTGVQVPIVRDERGYILDGFARAQIAEELGYECPSVTVRGLTEHEKRSQVRALNLARRHLDYAARRQVIADELKDNPRRSNNWIAKSLGVDDKTVAGVRKDMHSTSEIPKLHFTLGSDGKYRPATRGGVATNGNGRPASERAGVGEREYIYLDDEEALLRAAAQIRQRREFGDWEDSRRRIDLLGLDRDANLVVIELKRTEDGGHMELQAIRYAAMVSTLTFEKVVDVFSAYLRRIGKENDAQTTILEFLGWEDPDEDVFAQDVRIVLASAEFSKELTTAVMWLNEHGLDIRCVRMQPYDDGGRLLVDVQQVVPLPEAAAYQVQVREKEQRGRQERAERFDIRRRFWQGLLARAAAKTSLHANISPSESSWVGASSGMRGLAFNYVTGQHESRVELYIDRGAEEADANKRIFDRLHNHKEQIESSFGGELSWQRLDAKQSCRIAHTISAGGWRSDEAKWPEIHNVMIDEMVRLERALKPQIAALKSEFT